VISPVAKGLTLIHAALAPPDSALRASLYSSRKASPSPRCRMLGVNSRDGNRCQNEHPMNHPTFRPNKAFLVCAATLIPLGFLLPPFHAQTPRRQSDSFTNIQQELVRTEIGFFEAWKMKDQAYFANTSPRTESSGATPALFPATSNCRSRNLQQRFARWMAMAFPTSEYCR